METVKQPSVAVIGLGAQGLVSVKNLLEQSFAVTGFDRHAYVGGIWHYSAEKRLSALPSTVVNVSRERACFTDFPFPDGTPSYPNAAAMDDYLNAYADHFHLRPHLRLGTNVNSIRRDDAKDAWVICISPHKAIAEEELTFDKLVIAAGPHDQPIYPSIVDQHLFTGTLTHSISFKDASVYKNRRVMVIGASNTAADTCTALAQSAAKVYFAHRHGAIVLPRRLKDGRSLDHKLTYRHGVVNDWLSEHSPAFAQWISDHFVRHLSRIEYGRLDPDWRIEPAPSLLHQVPTVTDTLIPLLKTGQIESCQVPKRVVGQKTIELSDGQRIKVDTIICCTGYRMNLSFLGSMDPTLRSDGSREEVAPRLYQNIFSLEHPDSLAFIGYCAMSQPAALLSDLASMAVAQLWSRRPESPSLPPQSEMQTWYERHLAWIRSVQSLSPEGKIVKLSVQSGPWMKWAEEVTGTAVGRHLGYLSLAGWLYWFSKPRLCNLLMGGIWSPHMYRLFQSNRRKPWAGAREAIEKVNQEVDRSTREYKGNGVDKILS